MGLFTRDRKSFEFVISNLRHENIQLKNSLKVCESFQRQLLQRIDAKYSELPLTDDPRIRLLLDVVARLQAILVTYDRIQGRYSPEQFVSMVRFNLNELFSNLETVRQEAEKYAAERDAREDEVQSDPEWHSAEDTFSFLFTDSDDSLNRGSRES